MQMIAIQNNNWTISGDLNHSSVTDIERAYKSNFKDICNNWSINFEKCINIDSSGLALIVKFIKLSNQLGVDLTLKNINNKTLELAKIYGIYSIIFKYIK